MGLILDLENVFCETVSKYALPYIKSKKKKTQPIMDYDFFRVCLLLPFFCYISMNSSFFLFSGHAFKKIKLEEKLLNSDEKIKPDEKIKLEPVSPKKEDIIGKSNI